MAPAAPKHGSDPIWVAFLAFLAFVGVAMAVIVGRLITPSTVLIAPRAPAAPRRAEGPKPFVIPTTWQGKPISAWRRAYIAKHHHQPPIPRR